MKSKNMTRRLTEKSLERWRREFTWVDRAPGEGDVAYCKVCLQTLQPKRDKLLVHSKTNTHNDLVNKFNQRQNETESASDTEEVLSIETTETREVTSSEKQTLPSLASQNVVQSKHDSSSISSQPKDKSSSKLQSSESQSEDKSSSESQPEDKSSSKLHLSESQSLNMSSSESQPEDKSLSKLKSSEPQSETQSEILIPSVGENFEVSDKHESAKDGGDGDEVDGHHGDLPDSDDNLAIVIQKSPPSQMKKGSTMVTLKLRETSQLVQAAPAHLQRSLETVWFVPSQQNEDGSPVDKSQETALNSKESGSTVTKKKYFDHIWSEMENKLVTSQDSDLVWICQDASFQVHKLVLAINSKFFKRVLEKAADEDVVHTPDLSGQVVKSIICLFYTGRSLAATAKENEEILEVLKLLECNVDNFSSEVDSVAETLQFPTEKREMGRRSKRKITEEIFPEHQVTHSQVGGDIKLEVVEEFQDDWVDHKDDLTIIRQPRNKRRKTKSVRQTKSEPDDLKTKSTSDKARDSKDVFHFRGKGKGVKCLGLKDDLYGDGGVDGPECVAVCLLCYKYFNNKTNLIKHKNLEHPKKRTNKGPHQVRANEYKCSTCNLQIIVDHVVWFIKHLKFCGQDQTKANDLLAPGEEDEPILDPSTLTEDEDCLTDRRKVKDPIEKLSQFLIGRKSDCIWGCRTCYEAFGSKEELEYHRRQEHQGILRHGSCYDPSSRHYTCANCNTVVRASHLVLFIKHLKQCSVDPILGLSKDHEEEGVDDDTTEDLVDPWGVVNKPLRVVNLRSQWVCEALLGKLVPILFPCHVCYQVFGEEEQIKEHFSTQHRDMVNCNENGEHYNRQQDSFSCPVCKRTVCKNQRSSVYFTYHMKKCQGEHFPVSRTCPKCGQTFSNFRMYLFHEKTNCETQDFICHICSMHLKTNKDLANHIQYVHSEARPFVCSGCSKTFKRKGDLVVHEQSHNTRAEFSCEHCGKAFNMKKNLKRHIQIHTSIMDRPHQCPHCHLRFVRKQVLDNHIATHTPQRKFSCDICSVKVKTRDALKIHRKKVHKLTTKLPPSTDLEAPPLSASVPASSSSQQIHIFKPAKPGVSVTEPVGLPVQTVEVVAGGGAGVGQQNIHILNKGQIQVVNTNSAAQLQVVNSKGELQVVENKDEEYTLTGIKTPASEIPVKDEVIISQFQIITSM